MNHLHKKIFIVFISACFCGCGNSPATQNDSVTTSNTNGTGKKFELSGLLDSSGNKAELDFTKSDYTVIDFWNNECPPCINEMKQFPSLLMGKTGKISVISISVNQFWLWKPTLARHQGRFSFFDNKASNWTHLGLYSKQDPRLKNEISIDRLEELGMKYDISYFPAYFVVDRNGIIQSRPESAVEFLGKIK